jgi:WD40 repeat protein
VAVSPTHDKLAAGTPTRLVLFDLVTGTELASAAWNTVFDGEGTNTLIGLAFSPDGKTLAAGSAIGTLAFVDADTLKRLKPLARPHTQQIWRTAFALNGTVLVTGGGFGDGVAISDAASGRVLDKFAGIEGSFPGQPLAVSPNGQLLAVSSPAQFVVVRHLASGQVVARCPQKVRFLHAVTFSPDGKLVAYSDELGGIFLWDCSGQRPLRKLVGHRGPALDLAFSPDGRTLASTGMDHTIKLWHPEIEQEVATLEGHNGWVWCIAFTENGKTLVSGSRDGSLKVWRALSFEQIRGL